MINHKQIKGLAACAMTSLVLSAEVAAAPISGSIDFQGMAIELDLGSGVFGLDLNMDSQITATSGNAFAFVLNSGDFSSMAGPAQLNEFQTDFGGNGSHSLASVGGFEIELTSAQVNDGSSGTSFADFSGEGIVRYIGGDVNIDLDETYIQWQYASASNALSYTLHISTLPASPVPLPASAWLFLTSVSGLLIARKRS